MRKAWGIRMSKYSANKLKKNIGYLFPHIKPHIVKLKNPKHEILIFSTEKGLLQASFYKDEFRYQVDSFTEYHNVSGSIKYFENKKIPESFSYALMLVI